MKYILFTINFIHHCYLALGALPAPVNVTVESVNFEHILRWTPGQGTPPGTAYRVKYTCHGKQLGLQPSFLNSSVTMLNLTGTFKNLKYPYGVHVQALNGGVESNWSGQVFCPYTDTKLGPPQVSVTGHGDRLLLNITLPRGKAKKSIEKIYREFHFSIFWKKAGESRVQKDTTALKEPAIKHLHQGVQYCVRVQPEIIENQNLLSSDWTCHFTSPLPLNPVPTVLACVSVILILGSCAVLLGLIYTGFLYNWNPKPPNALMSLVQSYLLNVAVIVPDQVSVISEPKGIGGATGGGAQDNNEEEEEDGGNGGYENRAAGSSGATSSSSGGTVTTLTTDTSVSEDSGNSRTLCTMRVECGVPCAVGVLCLSERAAITGPSLSKQKQKEEEEEKGGDAEGEEGHCADINLFSVALGEQEQEEEEVGDEEGWAAELQPMDSEGEHQPLISVETDAGSRLIELGSSQTDDTVLSYLPRSSNQSEQGKTHSSYLQMHFEGSIQIDTQSALKERQEEEDEDEEGGDEEYSGYMRR
ncbi:interferon lambda receptor 1-like isoform X1 [Anguilla anguilla]|uniref:interferon lambda receptor 1-like isoform X1 n=2 Tax=Anguilla anguilla TaxID=7936 RepID=UPI0015AC764A|nr:interferon lambda receptor 1-like isoform X1 [Anguilla anguilla]